MRRRLRFSWVAGLLLLAPAAWAQAPAGGTAADKELAKEWANKAHERFEAQDYQGAIDAMMEAQKHARPPTFVRFLAQAHEKLGRLIEAERLYREVADTKLAPGAPPAFKKAQAEAKKDLAAVAKRISKLQLTITGADSVKPSVYIDGKAVSADDLARGAPIDPGKHTVVVEATGQGRVTRDIVLKEGATENVNIEVPPPRPQTGGAPSTAPGASLASPSDSPPMWLTVGKFAALGVGAAGLVAGAVTGGLVLGELDGLRQGPCSQDLTACRKQDKDEVERVRLMADISTAGFVVGGVLAAAGVVLLVLPPPGKKKAPPVGVIVNGAGIAVSGGF